MIAAFCLLGCQPHSPHPNNRKEAIFAEEDSVSDLDEPIPTTPTPEDLQRWAIMRVQLTQKRNPIIRLLKDNIQAYSDLATSLLKQHSLEYLYWDSSNHNPFAISEWYVINEWYYNMHKKQWECFDWYKPYSPSKFIDQKTILAHEGINEQLFHKSIAFIALHQLRGITIHKYHDNEKIGMYVDFSSRVKNEVLRFYPAYNTAFDESMLGSDVEKVDGHWYIYTLHGID